MSLNHTLRHAAAAGAVLLTALGVAHEDALTQSKVTAFTGARVLVGDGRVIDNATLVVEGARLTAVGPANQVKAPAGAAQVSLAGKTVMPAIIDTHTHLLTERMALDRPAAGQGVLRRLRWR